MIKVAVSGACGKMGRSIIRTLHSEEDMKLLHAFESTKSPHLGKDIGTVIGSGKTGVIVRSSDELDETLKNTPPDVLVDFTVAEAAFNAIKTAASNSIDMVVGTTGFSEQQMEEIKKIVEKNRISAVISPNMATGVNVFFKIVEEASKKLDKSYEVEIVEAHHRAKKDSPSGTALRAAKLIADSSGRDIKFHSIRAGDIVGDHTVLFAGNGERLEITHRAHSRQAFVNGAMKAIRFVNSKKGMGKIYSTWDVLGIE